MSGGEAIIGGMISGMTSIMGSGMAADAADNAAMGFPASEPWRALRSARAPFRNDVLGEATKFGEINKVEGLNVNDFVKNFGQHATSPDLRLRNFPNQRG